MEKGGGGSRRNRTFSGNEFIAGECCKDVGLQNSFKGLGQDLHTMFDNKFSAGERCKGVGIQDSFNALGQAFHNLSGNKFMAGKRCQNVGIKDSFNGQGEGAAKFHWQPGEVSSWCCIL